MALLDFLNNFAQTNQNQSGIGAGNTFFGDRQNQYSSIYSPDYSNNSVYSPTYNINSAGASGSVVTTKKEQKTTQTPTTASEKPLSFAPALVGGGSTTATGEAKSSSGLDLLPIAFIGGLVIVGLAFVGGKSGK